MTNEMMKSQGSQEEFRELTAGSSVLMGIKLMQPLSDPVTAKKAQPGEFMLVNLNLGEEFLAVIGPWRPHALHLKNKTVISESFDQHSDEFKAIERREAELKKTRVEGEGAMAGVDFLLWLPEKKTFGYYFFCKTAKQIADDVVGKQGELVCFTSTLVGKKFKWYLPEIHEPAIDIDATVPQLDYDVAMSQFKPEQVEDAGLPER